MHCLHSVSHYKADPLVLDAQDQGGDAGSGADKHDDLEEVDDDEHVEQGEKHGGASARPSLVLAARRKHVRQYVSRSHVR